MSIEDDRRDVIIDNEETQTFVGAAVKVLPGIRDENVERLIAPIMAEGPAYTVRRIEPLGGRQGKRSMVDLQLLPPDHQD